MSDEHSPDLVLGAAPGTAAVGPREFPAQPPFSRKKSRAPDDLKSAQFRREREPGWHELEQLLERLDKSGPAGLSSADLTRLPILYRATLSSLSVARNVSLDRNLIDYLESLAARAYFRVYGPKRGLAAVLGNYFRHDLPQAVRRLRWHIGLAAFLLVLGTLCGYLLTSANQDWFYTLTEADMMAGRTPAASTEALRQSLYEPPPSATDWLAVFGSSLFYHNSKIALACFALGFAFGVPTFLLTLSNGLMLGAFIALYASRGLGIDVLGWLTIHGTTELSALVIASGAGFALAEALLFPQALSRLDNLAHRGRQAGLVALGAVIMLLIAGGLEGLGRQLILETDRRLEIGGAAFLLWFLYFTCAGRGKDPYDDR
jgi:uncharacterized membrane protein SpoIIM required for sporulation